MNKEPAKILICPRCRCKKRIVGLGGIEKECPSCNGKGFLYKEIAASSCLIPEVGAEIGAEAAKSNPIVHVPKKRGRPKKEK